MTTLTRAEVKLGANDRELKAGLTSARSTLRRTGRRMGRIATRITATITAALAAAGAAAVKFAADFEQEMTRLETLVGLSSDSVAQFRQEILQLGPAVGRSPDELAQAMFAITSGGARGAEAMEILEQAAKASAVGLGDVEQIGRTATAALQAFGDQGLSATEAIDQMVATVRAGNLQARDLAGSLGRVMGIASTLGVRFSDMNAFIATFTRLGVSAEESATSLRAILQGLTGANKQAAEAFERLGIPLQEVRRTIREDGLVEGLQMMIQATDGNVEALTEIVPNIRALAGFLGTAGAQAEQFADIQADVRHSLGLTNEGFERASENLNLMIRRLRETGRVALLSIGDKLMPVVEDMVAAFQDDLPRIVEGIARAVGRVGLLLTSVASALQTDMSQTMLNLGIVIGARLGEGIFRGLEKALRASFPLAQIPGPIGDMFDRLNLAAAGAGALADTARDSAEKAEEALGILARSGGEMGGLRQMFQELANFEATAARGGGGGGGGGGVAAPGLNMLGFAQQLMRRFRQQMARQMSRLANRPAAPSLGALGIAQRGAQSMREFREEMSHILREGDRGRSVFSGLASVLGQVAGFADNLSAKLLRLGTSILNAVSQISSAGGPGGILGGIATGLGGFVGLFAHGGTLGRGEWGIAGEAGPEVVRGPAEVAPIRAGGGVGVIDASTLDPMGQLAAHLAMESPTLQRLFTAGVDSANRRRG